MACARCAPASSGEWQPRQTLVGPGASMASEERKIAWLLWHCTQPGAPMAAKASRWGLSSKSRWLCAWQVPHTSTTEGTLGGVAPWLPWQVAQVGAERSPATATA